MGYLYEMHCHTRIGSACGRFSGEELAKTYKKMGYAGVFVTDHFFNGNCAVSRSLSWEERVEEFFGGYRDAKTAGDRIGIDIFPAFEYSYRGTEFLTYGMEPEWVKNHPEIMDLDPMKYCELIRSEGGFITHAHPFREAAYLGYIRLMPHSVDAVEVFNAAHWNNNVYNLRAELYAESYGLRRICGSDAHIEQPYGCCAVETEEKALNPSHFIQILKSGCYRNLRLDSDGRKIMYI